MQLISSGDRPFRSSLPGPRLNTMRIAVFSDVHANPYALRAVLDALDAEGPFDAVVSAGDVCLGGSDAGACIDMLTDAGVQSVCGNADMFVFALPDDPPAEKYRARWEHTIAGARWEADRMGTSRLEVLKDFPFSLRFSPTGRPEEDLLVVHANPKEVLTHILPPVDVQDRLLGGVFQKDDSPELTGVIDGAEADSVAYGHFHYSSERIVGDLHLVNVASVGASVFDSDLRARYTVLTYRNGWEVERRFVEYDYRREAQAILDSDMPGREKTAALYDA